MAEQVVVVCGPTASGKTRLGVALAQKLNGEVVSTDSMQIYRKMDIGTAKPTVEEMEGVPHHMIDVADPEEQYSVARYVTQATQVVDDILARGKRPILVGGTGLYIDNLIAGRTFSPFSGQWRERLTLQCQQEGIQALYDQLCAVDPQRGAKLALGDEKRIIRALEVWHETGKTITEHDEESQKIPPRYIGHTIGLAFAQREDMWQRIDRRVDEMMAQGLVKEVQSLLAEGLSPQCTAMQAIGYKELVSALDGQRSATEAAEEVKLRSRQYAKRQLTWFRRNASTHWIYWDKNPDFSGALQSSTQYLAGYKLG